MQGSELLYDVEVPGPPSVLQLYNKDGGKSPLVPFIEMEVISRLLPGESEAEPPGWRPARLTPALVWECVHEWVNVGPCCKAL